MKKQTLAAAAALSLLFAASQAEALSITDTYWGAGIMSLDSSSPIVNNGTDTLDTGAALSGDVFDPNKLGYDISAMDVSILNGFLTVKIYSQTDNYFGKWLNDTIPDAPGDLFLSTTGWNPVESDPDPDGNGVQNYNSDGKGVGTDWNFVVALNGLYGTNDSRQNFGTATLYSTSAGSIEYGTARNAQEAWFSPSTTATSVGTGDWEIVSPTNANPYLLITTSLTNEMQNVREWGLHWTMACANDVIEGSFSPVPEPATVLLFGAGLAGLAAFGRRRGRN